MDLTGQYHILEASIMSSDAIYPLGLLDKLDDIPVKRVRSNVEI